MKKTILFFCFALLSMNLYANNIKEKNIFNESIEQNVNPLEKMMIACQHEYYVTSIGCDGYGSPQLMGAGTGDCGSAGQNSVIKHNTDVDVCDNAARDHFLWGVLTAAVAVVTRNY